MNDCENIINEVERRVNMPTATPRRLAAILGELPATAAAEAVRPSEALVARLEASAAASGGQVYLHGRLFAQFLHHAYPLECPYPHATRASTLDAAEWIHHSARASIVSSDAVEAYLLEGEAAGGPESGARAAALLQNGELPWTDDEDVFLRGVWSDGEAVQAEQDEPTSSLSPWSLALGAAAVAGVAALASGPR